VIEEQSLPLSPELIAYCEKINLDPLALALHGGEDYVLLCTGDAQLAASLSASGMDVAEIGRISHDTEQLIRKSDGTSHVLESGGWDHFSGEA
jgi:thiamine monophosphate kinase